LEIEALKPKIMLSNYYRSRIAELLFNHLAKQRGLDWQATSRAWRLNAE
jgi:protein-tyrosine-phosphatase